MHYFLRNHGMNVKIHNFSLRLCVLNRTTVQRKCGVVCLHSWLYTLGAFDFSHTRLGKASFYWKFDLVYHHSLNLELMTWVLLFCIYAYRNQVMSLYSTKKLCWTAVNEVVALLSAIRFYVEQSLFYFSNLENFLREMFYTSFLTRIIFFIIKLFIFLI